MIIAGLVAALGVAAVADAGAAPAAWRYVVPPRGEAWFLRGPSAFASTSETEGRGGPCTCPWRPPFGKIA